MLHEPHVLPPTATIKDRASMVAAANLALNYLLELQGLATLLKWDDLAEVLLAVVDAGDVLDPIHQDGAS